MNIRDTIGGIMVAAPFVAIFVAFVVLSERLIEVAITFGLVAVAAGVIFGGTYLLTHGD